MPTHNDKEEFLQEVLSCIKLPFGRTKIYEELNDHINDRANDFVDEGLSKEVALEKAIGIMGHAKDIGRELNQMHKPLLGWIWKITNIIKNTLIVIVGLYLIMFLLASINLNNPLKTIEKEDIVYHMKVNEKVQIDNRIIKVTDILYEKNGTLHVRYKTYSKGIFINSWNFSNIGTVTDEFGNEYYAGSSSGGGVIENRNIELEDFPEDSESLNIIYDRYNRFYELHFDLEERKGNE